MISSHIAAHAACKTDPFQYMPINVHCYRFAAFAGTVATLLFASADGSATSRMGQAEVREIDGTPCFSIPNDAETRNGVPLHAIMVSETKSVREGTLPEPMWHLMAVPYGKPITLLPKACLAYGSTLPGMRQNVSGELKPLRIYSVHLHARPKGSNLIGYDARFCLVPKADGNLTVKALPLAPDSKRFDELECND